MLCYEFQYCRIPRVLCSPRPHIRRRPRSPCSCSPLRAPPMQVSGAEYFPNGLSELSPPRSPASASVPVRATEQIVLPRDRRVPAGIRYHRQSFVRGAAEVAGRGQDELGQPGSLGDADRQQGRPGTTVSASGIVFFGAYLYVCYLDLCHSFAYVSVSCLRCVTMLDGSCSTA